MWTKIIHLVGLNKGQVEQMAWGSVGQAPLLLCCDWGGAAVFEHRHRICAG